MEPGNRGIRRHNKTADPLLCTGGGCYVSNGSGEAASFLPGRKALGIGRTFGMRAGACQRSLGCIFRGIELGSLPSLLQPVDMRILRHDRREAQAIDRFADCRVAGGRLTCRRTVQSGSYIMWVVPESVADKAGPAALERALAEGLPEGEHASLPVSVAR
jgi:colicin import membrane protein